eukprot:CAMPEP_0202087936 /NCGR_PEP_ID=MMETSP0964-20121228/37443_1 /ASSEMBLY_ACC=CAM_ASM_000500 /TAXON_ID=4773 /ORGANISM="Schizochytrium aggregatum, Strain ATCC28209" /LENGTH=33 /DNA_ID= /DNA_START= /DNA_END= /DNA_ORIENTATION=
MSDDTGMQQQQTVPLLLGDGNDQGKIRLDAAGP